jgi:ABC-type amino acid transport substrate-binding protein
MIKLIIAFMAAITLTACGAKVDESKIDLTEEELQFIASHPTVTWALEDNRPPYIFVENSNIKGLSFDYLVLISKKTGINFQPIRTANFFNSIEALKNKQVDVMTALRPTPYRADFMGFTPPIAYNGGVFLFRVNTLPRSPMTTGIRRGEAVKDYLKERFQDMKIVEVEDDEQSISLLQKGLLDGSVMDAGSANYLMNHAAIKMRKAAINFDYPYSFGYHKDNHILGSILTKAVISISNDDKKTLNQQWIKD